MLLRPSERICGEVTSDSDVVGYVCKIVWGTSMVKSGQFLFIQPIIIDHNASGVCSHHESKITDEPNQTKHLHCSPLPFIWQWFSLERSGVCEAVFITVKVFDSKKTHQDCAMNLICWLSWCEIVSPYVKLSLVLNWHHLLNLPDLFSHSIHLVIKSTDEYLYNVFIVFMFCESTNSSSLQSCWTGLHNVTKCSFQIGRSAFIF